MILIADSGSTKTTWCLPDENAGWESCTTSGINPFFLEGEDIVRLLRTEFSLAREGITSVRFYGAGCALPEKKRIVAEALAACFDVADIAVYSDLLAAAHSLCGNSPGIACILGTGSNSCRYDGQEIVQNVSPLGFILGDEGSGAVLGRKLLSGVLKNQFPASLREAFFASYPATVAEILENVYRKPFPNRYLAQYARFIASHSDVPEMRKLLHDSFCEFFQKNVMQYAQACHFPVHFTGSIAFFFREHLVRAAQSFGLTVGKISAEPMPGLIKYYQP
ncbi:MAG: ATPase [Bacteroidales bacterium]|jgi:N-acetylglucosamine kinase-like BadF-type ATPase|nr:ATPase [Bacteroidales bacterium]